MERLVIVGAGQAAAQAVQGLRARGYRGGLLMIGDEPTPPYQRPPLSKRFLSRECSKERLLIRPMQFYADHSVELLLGCRAMRIDSRQRRIHLSDGRAVHYDRLLLATGSRARHLPIPGTELSSVYSLRSVADAERIMSELTSGRRLVILGAGYIGLEVAATAATLGLDVTVLEAAPRILPRVTCPEISTFLHAEHQRHGVRIECDVRVQALEAARGANQVAGVRCRDGRVYPADIVLIGVGSEPETELAASAGLECANGIMVDEYCRTSAEGIYAAGDCTDHPSLRYECHVRLESVDNACEQGASAALNLLGEERAHDRVPWFWSDQFDLKLVIVGLSHGADRTVQRGDPQSRSFSVCYLRGHELLAIDTVNCAKDQIAARKLIAGRASVRLERLAQGHVPLRECVI